MLESYQPKAKPMNQPTSIRTLLEASTDTLDFDFDRVVAEFTEMRGPTNVLRDINTGEELFRAATES